MDAVETNLDVGVLWERARMVADVEGMPAAEPVLRQLLAAQPTHIYAGLMLGQHLLDREPGKGFVCCGGSSRATATMSFRTPATC